jgi:cytochrome c-type biogenesis protein CcmH/NrfG
LEKPKPFPGLKVNNKEFYTELHESGMSQNTSQKPIQRIFILISGIAFAGSTVFGMVGLFSNSSQQPKDTRSTTASKDLQLQKQAQGYELVLKREPNNQLALQGLVQARLQMNDLQGAVEPIEKLVKINPDNSQYKALLTAIKERVGKGK